MPEFTERQTAFLARVDTWLDQHGASKPVVAEERPAALMIPSGLCSMCRRPYEDHTGPKDKGLWRCPA